MSATTMSALEKGSGRAKRDNGKFQRSPATNKQEMRRLSRRGGVIRISHSNSKHFSLGEIVLAYHSKEYHLAKVIESHNDWMYFLHYVNWSKHSDEWVADYMLKEASKENIRKEIALGRLSQKSKNYLKGQTMLASSSGIKERGEDVVVEEAQTGVTDGDMAVEVADTGLVDGDMAETRFADGDMVEVADKGLVNGDMAETGFADGKVDTETGFVEENVVVEVIDIGFVDRDVAVDVADFPDLDVAVEEGETKFVDGDMEVEVGKTPFFDEKLVFDIHGFPNSMAEALVTTLPGMNKGLDYTADNGDYTTDLIRSLYNQNFFL